MKQEYTIDFEPIGRRGKCRSGESILDCARQLGIGISSICGGNGTCGSCKVRILTGPVSEPASNELDIFSTRELEDGWRLACRVYPAGDCKLSIPPESLTTMQRTQVEGLNVFVSPEPAVQSYHLELGVPSLSDSMADSDRLLKALNKEYQLSCSEVEIDTLRTLSPRLRSLNWECRASVRNNKLVAVGPPSGPEIGFAVDLGTTKIAGYLVDLTTGRTLASKGIMNPQISQGEDVISRINYAMESPDKAVNMQRSVIEALDELAADMCAEIEVNPEEILEAVVVGNTAIHHLFLRLPVKQLALSPYIPAVSSALDVKLCAPGFNFISSARVHLLPNIAGFVGADHVAMLLATDAWKDEGPLVAIDIGTNTEVSFINNGKITAVSCASGPAFEGGHIKCGMRAAAGAVENLRIVNGRVQYQTIDDAPPVGLCGSGILDAMAHLYLSGIIDKSGRMKDNHPCVRRRGKQLEFMLISRDEGDGDDDIVITQKDVRELQLAKAAIRTGIQVLLETDGCSEEEIKRVIIAGAFGSYIDVPNAITIGLLPSLPLDRFSQVGNAAGTGARMALISLSQRALALKIASMVEYIELGSSPVFMQNFVQANFIGKYRMENGDIIELD